MERAVHDLFSLAVDEYEFNRRYRAGMQGRFGEGILREAPSSETILFFLLMDPARQSALAAAKLYQGPDEYYIAFIEAARDQRGAGMGKKLYEHLYAHAANTGVKTMVHSQFSDTGLRHLMPMLTTLSGRYPNVQNVHPEWA